MFSLSSLVRFSRAAAALAVASVVAAVGTAPVPLEAQSGPIVARGVINRQFISVESADRDLANLARRAFISHGNYDLAAAGKSGGTHLQLSKSGATAVQAVFTSRKGMRVSQSFTGATWQEAALRACDFALERDGQRPFFAGKLAFISDRTGQKEVYAGDLFLSVVQPLTNYRSVCLSPRWTNTGEEVLYTTYANGNFTDIYAVNAVNPALRRNVVVGARGTTTGAVSNPKTGRLAFTSSARGDMDVFGADASGAGARLLIRTPKGNVETDPAWSPDGTQLAYVGGASGRPAIHVAKADGSASRRIATPGIGYATEPAWNPVFTTKIAFTYQDAGGFSLGVLDIANGQVSRIAVPGKHSYSHPVWSADGRHLVAVQTSGRTARLVLIDTLVGVAVSADNTGEVSASQRRVTVLSDSSWANCGEADYHAPVGK